MIKYLLKAIIRKMLKDAIGIVIKAGTSSLNPDDMSELERILIVLKKNRHIANG